MSIKSASSYHNISDPNSFVKVRLMRFMLYESTSFFLKLIFKLTSDHLFPLSLCFYKRGGVFDYFHGYFFPPNSFIPYLKLVVHLVVSLRICFPRMFRFFIMVAFTACAFGFAPLATRNVHNQIQVFR